MARTLEFDRAKVLDKAIGLFWQKGYQAASLSDLLQVMDIGRGSFYATFGDKRSLFIECLDLFGMRTRTLLVQARYDAPPLDALRHFFEHTATGLRGRRCEWGCMMVNTVLELAGVDDELSARASGLLAAIQAEFENCLRDAGLTQDRAAEFASVLMIFNEGLRVSSRRKVPIEKQLADIGMTFGLIAGAL